MRHEKRAKTRTVCTPISLLRALSARSRFSLASRDSASPTMPVRASFLVVVASFIVCHIRCTSRTQHFGETMVRSLWSRPRVKSNVTDAGVCFSLSLFLFLSRNVRTIFRTDVLVPDYRVDDQQKARRKRSRKKKNSRNENARASADTQQCWQLALREPTELRLASGGPVVTELPPLLLPSLIGRSLPRRRASDNAYLWQYILRGWSTPILRDTRRS